MRRDRLKHERQLVGLTQAQLASMIGVSQQTLSKHETGRTTPAQFAIIRQYERVLGIDAVHLFPDVFINSISEAEPVGNR